MKKGLVVALIVMAAFVGCKKSEEGSGAGTDTFKLVVPSLGTSLQPVFYSSRPI